MWKAIGIVILLAQGWLFADDAHWAFEPVSVSASSPGSIDGFVERRLAEKGLDWSQEADRQTLLRRLHLIVLGAPPSVEDMRTFTTDESPLEMAWTRMVDRVLAGLRYGDRRRRGPENDAWTARVPGITTRVAKLEASLEAMRIEHGLITPLGNVETVTFPPMLAQTIRMRIKATANGSAASL